MDRGISDGELVRKPLSGDSEAFTVLVRRYQDVTYAAAYSLVHNFHDAKDIAQEAWIKTYQRLVTYDPNRPFGAWIYRISKRCAIDWLRSCQYLPVEDLSEVTNIPDPGPQPDEEQEKRELHETVHKALSSLSELNRETTVLYYINGYSQREVSGILGVPLGTVKRRLHDSRELLRKEVMEMVREAFEENKLKWKFTQDVVNRVTQLKGNLTDYLPDEFRKLAQMSRDELKMRRNHLLRSLADSLSIPTGKA
jgi:RNA polymerase sigma factor (sigma-70 family)